MSLPSNVALVHDWLVTAGGAERCLSAIGGLFPGADLYTLVYAEEAARLAGFRPESVHASFLQRLPRAQTWYPKYLPLFPLAVEGFDLDQYDLVISSSWAVAKGALTHSGQLHICYCHTPMRYAWDLTHDYLRQNGLDRGLKGLAGRAVMHYLRLWDLSTANRVDHFVANSHYVARRISRTYRRESRVIYPPVEVHRFSVQPDKENYFLFVSRLVPYKRLDLVVEAFRKLRLPLVVIGDGPERRRLERHAPDNVLFLGWLSDQEVQRHMEGARALIFAADEDFGIVPVEAQACGTPVIAYGRGGVTESVVPWERGGGLATGLFFGEQRAEALEAAVREFVAVEASFSPTVIRANAERFARERFEWQFRTFVNQCRETHPGRRHAR